MKKITFFACAAIVFAACTKDAPVDNGSKIPVDKNAGLTVIASASDQTTRTQFSDGESGFVLNWVAEEDKIGFYVQVEGSTVASNLAYSADNTASRTSFSPVDGQAQWADETSSHSFYAYYPYNSANTADISAVPVSVPAEQVQSQADNTEHLAALDFIYAKNENITKTADGSVTLGFSHPLSFLEFGITSEQDVSDITALILRCSDPDEILSAEGATINLSTGQIDYSAATVSPQITLLLTSPESLTAGAPAKRFFAQITPGHAGKLLQVLAVSGGDEILLGTKFVPASGIPAGRKAVINFGVSSKVRLSDAGTANCYIVNKPSTQYMFNATVKGNGQPAQYDWTDNEGTAMSKTISAADVVVKPKGAKLLWTTNSATSTVIENVSYDSSTGMISFETPAAFIDGNAVIAAYDNAECTGDVLWSWHIWAVEDYDAAATAIPLTSKSLNMMDRNLGATLAGEWTNTGDLVKTVGLVYQWGRKDPFTGPANVVNADGGNGAQGLLSFSPDGSIAYGAMYGGNDRAPRTDKVLYQYYAYNDGMQQVASSGFTDDVDGAIAQSVKEPWRYHANASGEPYVGITTSNYAYTWLWGNPTGNADGGSKSIYDPCPVGWKVAPKSVYSYLGSQARANRTYGIYFGDVYLNYTGLRTGSTGFFEKVNAECDMWSDCAYSAYGYATRMQAGADNVYSNSTTYPGYAMPLRCVSEGNVDFSDYVEDLSKNGTSNSYVVSKAATTYKFKATVKGNGVDPLGSDASISPTKARILWGIQKILLNTSNPATWPQNNGNDNTLSKTILYSSVSLQDGYISFTTADQMEDANIIIAATDDDGNILWTWHLWCVNGYYPDMMAQSVTTKGINSVMMDRNLGAFTNPAVLASPTYQDYSQARGLYYQWGRKDPFPGMRSISGYNSYVAWSDADGNISSSITWASGDWNTNFIKANNAIGVTAKDYAGAVAYVTANPMVFIKNGDSYTWIGPGALDAGTTADWGLLWGNQSNAAKGTKTMYDPCPQGYMVPSTKQLEFITSHGDQSGYTYSKLYPWHLNTKELIYDAEGNNVGAVAESTSPFTNEPYGLDFYVHGSKSELVEGDEGYSADATYNIGKAPADAAVSYFPSQGFVHYSGVLYGISGGTNPTTAALVMVHSNAPDASVSYGGRTKFMKACPNGDFYYNTNAASWAEMQNTGRAVRCVKE